MMLLNAEMRNSLQTPGRCARVASDRPHSAWQAFVTALLQALHTWAV